MNNTNESVIRQLARLQDMSVAELKDKFFELYGFRTNQSNAKNLRSRIAYRIQELFYGALPENARKQLEKVARQDSMSKLKRATSSTQTPLDGVRIRKEWHGETYEVILHENGSVEYRGRIYRSLTRVAKEITGTQWNGPAFFGLKKK